MLQVEGEMEVLQAGADDRASTDSDGDPSLALARYLIEFCLDTARPVETRCRERALGTCTS